MACDVQSLLANSNCFQCLSPGEWELIELALLCRIQQKVTGPCDLATLLGESNCFQCLHSGQRKLVALALLCQISGG